MTTTTNLLPADEAESLQRVRDFQCLACGTPLPEGAPAKRTYCHERCRKTYNRARANQAKPSTRSGTCKHCGHTFTEPRKRGPISKYCTNTCMYKARHAREYVPAERQPLRPDRWQIRPGDRFSQLVILERMPGSLARVQCDCGSGGKIVAIRNMTAGLTQHCAGPAHRFMQDVTTYGGAHGRVAAVRGAARAHICALCRTAQAEQWAYSHGDPDQRQDATGKDAGRVYSLRPDQYKPMCRRCHGRWDKARRRQGPLDALSLGHVALAMLTDDTDPDDVHA